jgi:hypothetical protein
VKGEGIEYSVEVVVAISSFARYTKAEIDFAVREKNQGIFSGIFFGC